MKQITISIPEGFYKTFMEFFKHIPEAKIETTNSLFIPEWHKNETLKRIKSSKKGDFALWSSVKGQLKDK